MLSVGANFDPTYIRIFKLLDKMRLKMRHSLDNYLRNLPLPREWLTTGRAAIPRLLFVFKLSAVVAAKLSKDPNSVRTLEQNLVNQLFNSFYETGLISNTPGNQLFLLPGHNFVHVLLGNQYSPDVGHEPVIHDDLSQEYFEFILTNLGMDHLDHEQTTNRSKTIQSSLRLTPPCAPSSKPWDFPPPGQPEQHTLDAFLRLHIADMLDQTLNRTGNFSPTPVASELPTCKAWFMACYKLYTSLMAEDCPVSGPAGSAVPSLDSVADRSDGSASSIPPSLAQSWQRALISILSPSTMRAPASGAVAVGGDLCNEDPVLSRTSSKYPTDPLVRLSELRCRAALSAAEAHYKQDLPIHYSNSYHLVKMVSAFNVLISLARGCLVFRTLRQLAERLTHLYLAGRVTCSAVSLTGHPCQHEMHRLPEEAAVLRSLLLSIKEYGSEGDHVLVEGPYNSRLSATNRNHLRDIKSAMESTVPQGIVGKWRTYWIESAIQDYAEDSHKAEKSSNGDQAAPPQQSASNLIDETKQHLTVVPHQSDAVLVSACSCGRQQAERPDPFDYKDANWRFYSLLANVCCNKLTSTPLAPLFLKDPGHPFCLPNEVTEIQVHKRESEQTADTKEPVSVLTRDMAALTTSGSSGHKLTQQPDSHDAGLSQPMEHELLLLSTSDSVQPELAHSSPGTEILESASSSSDSSLLSAQESVDKQEENEEDEEEEEPDNEDLLVGRRRVHEHPDQIKTEEPETIVKSTSEESLPLVYAVRFRDGVPTSDWLIGDFPRYPSWSIYALGKYFSYSHSSGLSCRGFLRNSNFLLPWDATIGSGSWSAGGRGGKLSRNKYRGRMDSDTVKLFIGFEMECPLGHRFFLAGPDRAMDGPMQSSQVRRAVHGLLTRDLPLFMPCRCQRSSSQPNTTMKRGTNIGTNPEWVGKSGASPSESGTTPGRDKTVWAQLSRIYLAIPAAPIRVRLQPRVRPGPPKVTPIFHMGPTLDQCEEGTLEAFSDSENDDVNDGVDFDDDDLLDSKTLEYRKPLFQPTRASAKGKQRAGFVSLDNGFLWVVRLPFAYHDGTKQYTRPVEPEKIGKWRLLKGCIRLQV
ncbi:unnamed protein product [Calicophoron daubneyi]|uniref:Nonsense-mediated mRNA decay factor SMG8 n=1 Tax=Calicophoron daubneyi TaxID=300641 RepID=A0AAV2TSL5_CALDB